jgi:hypothetical protein
MSQSEDWDAALPRLRAMRAEATALCSALSGVIASAVNGETLVQATPDWLRVQRAIGYLSGSTTDLSSMREP